MLLLTDARIPSLSLIFCPTENPGMSFSTKKLVMSLRSGPVRAYTKKISPVVLPSSSVPLVIHIFWPVSSHLDSSWMAFVAIPKTSVPRFHWTSKICESMELHANKILKFSCLQKESTASVPFTHTCIGFTHSHPSQMFSGHNLWKEFFLLFGRSIDTQIVDQQEGMGQITQTKSRIAVREFFVDQCHRGSIQSGSPVFLVHGQPQQSQIAQLFQQGQIEGFVAIVFQCLWFHLVLDKISQHRPQLEVGIGWIEKVTHRSRRKTSD